MHVVDRTTVVKELVVAPLSKIGLRPQPFKIYRETADGLCVPRFWRPELGTVSVPEASRIACSFEGTLRADLHQPEACAAVLDRLRSTGGAILCLPTGYGKTTCGLFVVAALGLKTLIVVHKTFLRDQFAERIAQVLPGTRVTFVDGSEKDWGGDVVIGTIQTLLNLSTIPDDIGTVLIDETHHIAARSFSQLLLNVSSTYILGLSATPQRADGLWHVVELFCGKIAYQKVLANSRHVNVVVARYEAKEPTTIPCTRRGDVDFAGLVTRLTEDPDRNALIVHHLQLHPENTLVLTHRRLHCLLLEQMARRLGLDVGVYVGGTKTLPDSSIIISTYAMTSEGFDCPRLKTLVLATPASDVQQACGRVMRGGAGGSSSVIVDVVDNSTIGWSQHAKRKAYYRKSGFVFGVPGTASSSSASSACLF